MTDFCRETGLRVIGLNCNGLINWHNGFVLSATSAITDPNGRAGPIRIVSQSGGLGQISVMWRALQMGLGIGLQATCGNESDLQAFDIATLMVDDPARARSVLTPCSSGRCRLPRSCLDLNAGRDSRGAVATRRPAASSAAASWAGFVAWSQAAD